MRSSALDWAETLGRFLQFCVKTAAAMPVALFKRPGAVIQQFERVAWGTLPIVAVAGVSIGLVTWLQMHRLLVSYGAQDVLPSVLAAAVLIETGPILASILVASRLGAGLAAELGTMTLTEEIDARNVLGAPPIVTLVAPRAMACLLAVPLLTVILDASALGGGLVAELLAGTLSSRAFLERSLDFLWLRDVIPSTLKTAIFGLIVGLVACWMGLNADRSAEAVGHAATRGVVWSTLAVFIANAILVPMLQTLVDALDWVG